jgi:hypothetical protein
MSCSSQTLSAHSICVQPSQLPKAAAVAMLDRLSVELGA